MIDGKACVRCAACVTVAPAHFAILATGPARVVRLPETPLEHSACESAAALCPTQAISPGPRPAAGAQPTGAVRQIYPSVVEVAEAARWKIADMPWKIFDASKATPQLRAVVRE